MARGVIVVKSWRGVWNVGLPVLLATLFACSGGGNDGIFELPPGDQFDSVRSSFVLVTTNAQNECGATGDCVLPPPGTCHTGSGNARGLAVYRLGTSGLLLGASGESTVAPSPEQVIATDDNPRRLIAHPLDPTLLYVATKDRIQVFRLAPDGGTRCIDETLSQQEVRSDADSLDPVDLEIDPTVGFGVLYVAARDPGRIDAYSIALDGSLPDVPTSCAVGRTGAQFQAVAALNSEFIAAGGETEIEIFARANGQLVNPPTTPDPDATATPSPQGTPIPSPKPTCIGSDEQTEPVSAIGAAIVTDLLFSPSASAPLGQLFVSEEASRRIFTYPIDTGGQIDADDSSSTERSGLYQTMLRHERGGSSLLYVSVFQEGQVEAFRLENGLLPDKSFSETSQDVNSLPVGLAVAPAPGNVLYVAQGGINRVDGFSLAEDGSISERPLTSTAPVFDTQGRTIDTFPNDVVIVPLP